jgi:hypothetical protein
MGFHYSGCNHLLEPTILKSVRLNGLGLCADKPYPPTCRFGQAKQSKPIDKRNNEK